jgi:hypothetical protein
MVVAGVLLAALAARAESPAEQEAKQHFLTGQKAFDAARWSDALAEFKASYALSKYPALIYKIALCHDQLGEPEAALAAYEQYLREDPQTQRRAGVEERIGRLERQLAKPAPPRRVETPPPVATPAVRVEAHTTPLYKKWWLWTIVGVAVAGGVAVGLGVGLTQGGVSRDYPWNPDVTIGPPQAIRVVRGGYSE